MSEFLPEAVRKGLEDARVAMLRRSTRLCVHEGETIHRVLRLWDGGFALAEGKAPPLRGYVDLYDGARHLATCLVVASRREDGQMIYEFKRSTAVADHPALDFAREGEVPAGLIPRLI